MKIKASAALFTVATLFICSSCFAEFSKVHVQRIDQDLYADEHAGKYITTRFCYELAGQDALLNDNGSHGSELIFENGITCQVVKILQKPKPVKEPSPPHTPTSK